MSHSLGAFCCGYIFTLVIQPRYHTQHNKSFELLPFILSPGHQQTESFSYIHESSHLLSKTNLLPCYYTNSMALSHYCQNSMLYSLPLTNIAHMTITQIIQILKHIIRNCKHIDILNNETDRVIGTKRHGISNLYDLKNSISIQPFK